ncbi:hypothetical protein GALMADRAFT_227464 [Galerina marginata CBS 339.88]|uniref:Peptidase C14 caspase domain-containing protein n=1 Tax=Galerina marginata (strain CBS 339.88) TaxID=685588 RepID=A0A067T5Y2_GALM3|nr:hypothetical protein GALMADRAFT_227464 [Galerina marginata CBS 339.88]
MACTTSLKHGFVLCIGINNYKSNAIPPLRGAVADARDVAGYLRDQLKVPQDHITVLENESATQKGILQGLQLLANDPRIRYGDPILIFYAGHGSEAAAPLEWEAGGPNANIQLVVPYDAYCESGGGIVAPIPDRTFGALLDAIAQEKGNNIFVIMDSCYSASGTRSLNGSSGSVRYAPFPHNFQFQGKLDPDLPANGGLRSHVLLSACASSGQAWESEGRGVFTVALLDLLRDSQIDKLRYSDIVMQMEIDPKQTPHCEGFNRDAFIFTTTSPPPIEYFILVLTRKSKNGSFAYILNGGAAHGLVVGDRFVVHSDIDCPKPIGTLAIEEVGSFYSIMRPPPADFHIASNSVAVRINLGNHEPRQNVTADFPSITKHVQVEIYELHKSQSKFPGSPATEILPATAVPYENDSFSLKPGSLYGLKLTNNSSYDLYPTVRYSDGSKSDTWYRPACSRSKLDVPLKMDGGFLTIGYGSGGSPPLVIPSSTTEGPLSLKILLSTRPLDTLYDDKSFRSARFLPDHLKGPWATLTRSITYRSSKIQNLPPHSFQSPKEFLISKPAKLPTKPCELRSLVPFKGSTKSVLLLDSDFHPPPIYDPFGWWTGICKLFRSLHGMP